MSPKAGHDPACSRVVVTAASIVILMATFLPWGTRFGSAVNGWQESGAIIAVGNAVASTPLRWFALTWYGIPLAAAGIWLALWATPRAAWVVPVLAASIGALTALALVVHASAGGHVRMLGAALVWASVAVLEVHAWYTRPAGRSRAMRRRR